MAFELLCLAKYVWIMIQKNHFLSLSRSLRLTITRCCCPCPRVVHDIFLATAVQTHGCVIFLGKTLISPKSHSHSKLTKAYVFTHSYKLPNWTAILTQRFGIRYTAQRHVIFGETSSLRVVKTTQCIFQKHIPALHQISVRIAITKAEDVANEARFCHRALKNREQVILIAC